MDSFSGITGLSARGLSFQNDALNTTSEIRALSVTGATLVGGSFQVLNGATLQFTGGNVNNVIFNRNTGGSSGTLLVADTAAAPNLGVGINAASNFTLNGNKGSATPQTVNIVPSVGKFHVGDGAAGVLSGTAAQAKLLANLTAATSVDINGATSSLDLNKLTVNVGGGSGTLTVGGMLIGAGTVNGNVTVLSGGTHGPGNSPGFQTVTGNADYQAGSTFAWDLDSNVVLSSLQSGPYDDFDQVAAASLSIASGAIFTITLNGTGSTVDFADAFWSTNQEWLVFGVTGAGTGDFTLGSISLGSLSQSYSTYGNFDVANVGGDVYLNWTVAAIPEPSTTLRLGIGLGALTIFRRRRG